MRVSSPRFRRERPAALPLAERSVVVSAFVLLRWSPARESNPALVVLQTMPNAGWLRDETSNSPSRDRTCVGRINSPLPGL